ncbi:hypothetical protein [Bergeyella zoohelcum]|uniref:Uncharacterized protein n=1 Tax=Bergeyella zoohelcum TaxID=1015 RepID=A0A7Z8YLQ2_9FLAO|nr:hypothetical protein [Bergeyella zoohelcum]VDH02920.1 Uncharacterised protein [Bergeyella zoohelcum]
MKELIFYGGLVSCVLYLIYAIYKQATEVLERDDKIMIAEQNLNRAKKELGEAKQRVIGQITQVFGRERADKVDKGIVWVGMPYILLMVAMGKAQDIKESLYKGVLIEKWYYGKYQTRLGTYKYKLEITLEDGEVVGWKDLV